MNEMQIRLTARAGCWSHVVMVDGKVIAERRHHCFSSAAAALRQALNDLSRLDYSECWKEPSQ
jgi:hypothetical protein